jgi:predicted ATPase
MPFLRRIQIEGLFGLYDHEIRFRDSRVTIVAGPNGIGKTTLLGLTRSVLQGTYRDAARAVFTRLVIESESGQVLVVSPVPLDESIAEDQPDRGEEIPRRLRLELHEGEQRVAEATIEALSHPLHLALPTYVEPHGRDTYFDTRTGDLISVEEAIYRYGGRHRAGGVREADRESQVPEWFDPDQWRVDFIETKRLDTLISRGAPRRRDAGPAPIDVYLGDVRQALETARRDSAVIRQRLDRTYVRRLLNRAKDTVNETALRERYSRIESLAGELQANGLLSDSLEVLQSGKLTPTDKRIVNLFLDDFEAKLRPLIPVSQKLEQLRAVIGGKFVNKTISVDPASGIVFLAMPDNQPISPDALSSGEQHAFALISRLLFTEQPDTTVMIDEPELSLHVSWQHAMVDDLAEIAPVAGLRFLLATHSTAIINNRWELVEELGPIDDSRGEV